MGKSLRARVLATLASTLVVRAAQIPQPRQGPPDIYWCNALNTNDVEQTCYCSKFWEVGWDGIDPTYKYIFDIEFKTDDHLASLNALFDGMERAVREGKDAYSTNVQALYQGSQSTHNLTMQLSPIDWRDWSTLNKVGAIRAFRRGSYEKRRLVGNIKWLVRTDTQFWNWTPEHCWRDTQCGSFNNCNFAEGGYMSVLVGWGWYS
ncbi:hypothetical protein RJ55_04561 [Drechmeria coniospora]|nr:hypothetical protein RJ55_04561 [Drechmeria coniospora]